ncbi:chemotaxis protein [Dissulfurispira thermophila]|uniref:protein-glutamate O-methyltransferase n=1 Tax=Dissulfurispira thermophila TaxID=2715679 RepID=A0A7G1H2M3_9BACT|nr:CheR family methyltransferase [Dissulfurispira thermophila]BCB96452.1 chemotaxis protein [Dissulfurispira thermophila]
MSLLMTDDVFKQLRDFIYEKSGIFIPDNKKYFLENRLGKRLQEKNLKGYEDYLYILKYGSDKNELNTMFNLVTTNETFFFREPQQFNVFAGELFNRVVAENAKTGRRDIKIWSAACSTGEEPYTIAMILMEKPEAAAIRKEIYASDISDSVLNSAKAGIYGSYAIRNVPDTYLKKYFINTNQQYSISSAVKSLTKFMKINLIDDRDVRAVRGVDVIFCRNVLIYFDDKAKQKAVANLYDSLRPNGYLFVGTSESLHNVTRAFRPVVINKVIIYQKV